MNLRAVGLTLLLVLLLGTPASARSPTPYPKWTGARVYTPRGKTYPRLDRHITDIESRGTHRYTVVVVSSSGNGNWATRNYLDALYARWVRARDASQRLKAPRHILLVLALENRQLAVRASTELQSQYGLRGQAVDRNYVRPNFIGYARSGRYEDGLIKLIDAFEAVIAKVDRRLEASAAQAKRRTDALRATAAQQLKDLPDVLAQAETSLRIAAGDGLDVTALERRLNKAGAGGDEARKLLATDPVRAAQAAGQAVSEVGGVRSAVAAMRAAATVVGGEIARLSARLTTIEATLERLSAEGMSVGELRTELERIEVALASAQAERRARPADALRAVRGLGESAGRLEQLAAGVPAEHTAWQRELSTLGADLERLTRTIAVARDEGVDVGAAVETRDAVRAAVGGERPDSYRHARTSMRALQRRVAGGLDALAEAQTARRFWTHELPRYIGLGIAGLLLLFVLVRLIVRTTRKRRVVALLRGHEQTRARTEERLETLRQTHRQLTLSDPDFTASLRGETRRVYDNVGATFDEYRRMFRRLGQTWGDAEELVEREGLLTWKRLDEAYAELRDAPPPSLGEQIKQRVELPLARLDQAHELARAAEGVLTADLKTIAGAVDEVGAAGLGTQAYASTRRALERQLAEGSAELRHDPLGVAASFEAAHVDANALVVRTRAVLAQLARAKALEARETELHAEAEVLRADGFRFVEPNSDPDPILRAAAGERERGVASLDAGDPLAGERALDQAAQRSDEAAEAMRVQVEGRTLCRDGIPEARSESVRLRELMTSTQPHLAVLEAEFDPRSWADVEELEALGEETLTTAARRLSEAQAQSTDDAQRYAHAGGLVREVQAAFAMLEAGLLRAAALRAELAAARTACTQRLEQLGAEGDRIRSWFEQDDRDRAPANKRLDRALRNLRGATDRAAGRRPHWPELAAVLTAVAAGLTRAEELAAADVRLAAAAGDEIDEARRRIEDADGFYGRGVSADLAHAEEMLAEAERALRRQEYEEAVIRANDAEQAADEAQAEAEEEVEAKRRAERAAARRQSSRDTGLGIMGSGFGSSSSSSSGFSSWGGGSSGSSFGGGGSGTSQSSW